MPLNHSALFSIIMHMTILRIKHHLARMSTYVPLIVLFVLIIAPEWPVFADDSYRIDAIVGLRRFDFLLWETEAILQKAEAVLADEQAYLDETTQQQVVLNYLALMAEIDRLNGEIDAIYIQADMPDADTAAQANLPVLQAELAQVRDDAAALQPLAEAIVQDQVAWALRQEGFTLLGQTWPPVMMHMTPLPLLLVVSPRDHVESIYQVSLYHGLTTPVQEEMETAVYENVDLSALVVPIGGMGTYPAMIMETASINWLAEVTAHEWTHHWLTFQPLGVRYAQDPQMRIINETVASMVDVEIRDIVIAQFYPDFLPAPAASTLTNTSSATETPPPFNFRAEMAQTRLRVDELLAAGQVDGAEAYMEERREFFVANGYAIRKLNQAYFAFYGAYASQPGATGGDPIGPMLRVIRDDSPSLHAFLQKVGQIKQYEDLLAMYEEVGGPGEE